ncbi:MAG TPA: helix-turn-helix domain-containing GNAT family N-acetyltransferase [Streptosporangiaceae bacterium]|jgi:DNA-binding MarR family transcriptional regulator/GNAT superfamily N-acetyltransferase|nr:helix-turn-helix domain-containing GNAT family N-acetyltransferase [Streptosporangiaceae bacterium]
MTTDPQTEAVAEVRAFNRFYTNVSGLLRGGHLDSPYSLTEVRVLFELAHTGPAEGAGLRRSLDIDAGYLSRILARFDGEKLTVRERSASDGRRQVISLTGAGRAAIAELEAKQDAQTAALLAGVGERNRERLLEAMRVIREVLPTGGAAGRPRAYLLRPPRPGDLGWVVHRHGAVYAVEYGFDETFEHLVARIVADYAGGRDPDREAAWIAEVDGAPAGCVFCMRKDDATAQLRLLLVEPSARGLGVGARLTQECLRFARSAGYERIMLWTQDCLAAARHVYQQAGFELVEEDKHHSFGQNLVGQIWSRSL